MIAIDKRRNTLILLIDYFAQEALKASEEGRAWSDTTDLIFFRAESCSDNQLFNTYRSLVNVRPAMKLPEDIAKLQDEFLQNEAKAKGIVDGLSLFEAGKYLTVFQGDITRLKVDAIVNAANSELLGCWAPLHDCIDNCIHTYAGTNLRLACSKIMSAQGSEERVGQAKLTKGYNLPARFILHTVGPTIYSSVTKEDVELLSSCYISCLNLAEENGLKTIAFCCISTGVFHFPNELACKVAVETVKKWQKEHSSSHMKVIFNVFKDQDEELYQREIKNQSLLVKEPSL